MPTIVVNGGNLIGAAARSKKSSAYDQAAIVVNGGTVDRETPSSPGGNTLNVNDSGEFIQLRGNFHH